MTTEPRYYAFKYVIGGFGCGFVGIAVDVELRYLYFLNIFRFADYSLKVMTTELVGSVPTMRSLFVTPYPVLDIWRGTST